MQREQAVEIFNSEGLHTQDISACKGTVALMQMPQVQGAGPFFAIL